MKKIVTFILAFMSAGLIYNASAQSCTPPAPTGTAGLEPDWECLPCVIQAQAYDEVIYIENFSTVSGITVTQLEVDTITNAPEGLSYVINPADGKFSSGETGCVRVSGTSNDTVGDYRLNIYVRVTIDLGGAPISIPAQPGNYLEITDLLDQIKQLPGIDTSAIPSLDYYMRVRASMADCNIPDSCMTGINQLDKAFTNMTINPNPFNNQTVISFTSEESGTYQAILFDVVGKEVRNETLNVTMGINKVTLDRGDLTKGVYFYTITDGRKSISKRIVIRE